MLITHVGAAIIPQTNGIVIPTIANINKKNSMNAVRIDSCYSDEKIAQIFSEWFPGRIEGKLTETEVSISCLKIEKEEKEKKIDFNKFRLEIRNLNAVMNLQQVFCLLKENGKIIFQDIDEKDLEIKGKPFLVSDRYPNIFFVIDKTKIIRISISYYSYSVVGFGFGWWMNVEKINENDDICVHKYGHVFCSGAKSFF